MLYMTQSDDKISFALTTSEYLRADGSSSNRSVMVAP